MNTYEFTVAIGGLKGNDARCQLFKAGLYDVTEVKELPSCVLARFVRAGESYPAILKDISDTLYQIDCFMLAGVVPKNADREPSYENA